MKKLFFLFLLLCHAVWAVFCPYCGANNGDEFQFCHNCGKSLSSAQKIRQQPSTAVTGVQKSALSAQSGQFSGSSAEAMRNLQQQLQGLLQGAAGSGGTQGLGGLMGGQQGGVGGLSPGALQNMLQGMLQSLPQGQGRGGTGASSFSQGSLSGKQGLSAEEQREYFRMSSPEDFAGSFKGFMGNSGVQNLLQMQDQDPANFDLEQMNQDAEISGVVNMIKDPAFQQQLMQGLQMMAPHSSSNQELQEQMHQLKGLFQILNQQGAGLQQVP